MSLPAQSIRGKGEKTELESCLAAGKIIFPMSVKYLETFGVFAKKP